MVLEIRDLENYVVAGANIERVKTFVRDFNSELSSYEDKVKFKGGGLGYRFLDWEGLLIDFYQMRSGEGDEATLFEKVIIYTYYDFLDFAEERFKSGGYFDFKEQVDDYLCFGQLEKTIAGVGESEEFDEKNFKEFQLFLIRWETLFTQRFTSLREDFKTKFRHNLFPIDS